MKRLLIPTPVTFMTSSATGAFVAPVVAVLVISMGIIVPTLMGTGVPSPIDDNVTVIEKTNEQWPIKGEITLDGCQRRPCVGI